MPDNPHRPLHVLQRRLVLLAAAPAGDAVLQQDGGDAVVVQPATYVVAFDVHREHVVSPAGTNHDRRAGVLVGGGAADGDRRARDVRDADLVLGGGFAELGPDVTLLAGRL